MLKITEHKACWVAPASQAVISNQLCDSILKGNRIDDAFYCLIKIFWGFYVLQGWLAKGFLELHMLLLCLAFLPYWIPLKDKQHLSVCHSESQADTVELHLGRIRRKIERNVSGAPVVSKGVMGLLLPKMNSTCCSKAAGNKCCCT